MDKMIITGRCTVGVYRILSSFLAVTMLGGPSALFAMDYKVEGGISVGYDRYERKYDKGKNSQPATGQAEVTMTEDLTALQNDEYNRFRIAPLVVVTGISARDGLLLRYSPSFRYDYDSSDHDLDHDLTAQFNRFITRDWQLKLSEKYLLTDSVFAQNSNNSTGSIQLSDNTSRRKYWTNDLGFISEYTYWEDSLFSLGYSNDILENVDAKDATGLENYVRHEGSLSVAHRFDSIWKMTVTAKYVRGLFDQVETSNVATEANVARDLSEYRASTLLESSLIAHHPLSLLYNFLEVDYDDTSSPTTFQHDVTFGWKWEVDKGLWVNLGGGPSYQETEGQDGSWGYNANAGLKYTLEHSNIEVKATHGYDRQNFTGTNESGLREFSEARLDYQYQIFKDLSLTLFTSYRYEDQDEVALARNVAGETGMTTTVFNRQRYGAGTSAGYRFWQWYTLNLSYEYLLQDSDKTNDSYTDHRLLLTLSMEKELFSW